MTSETELIVWRCDACGDTFPLHDGDSPVCPSCGNDDVHHATEPLL